MAVKALTKRKAIRPQLRSGVLDRYEFKDPAMKAWVAKLLDSFTDEEAKTLAKVARRKSAR